MRKPSAAGGAWSGQPLKKSPKRRTHDHLHRRKRNKPTAASRANLVAARRDSRSAVQLQLGPPLGGSRDHVLQLLFPAVRGQREKCAGGRLHAGAAPPHFRTAVDHLGPAVCPPQQDYPQLHRRARRALVGGIPPRLRTGTESGRIHLGLLEAACSTECVPEGLLELGRDSAPGAEENAPPTAAHHRLLAAVRPVLLMSLYYAKVNKRLDIPGAAPWWSGLHLSQISEVFIPARPDQPRYLSPRSVRIFRTSIAAGCERAASGPQRRKENENAF